MRQENVISYCCDGNIANTLPEEEGNIERGCSPHNHAVSIVTQHLEAKIALG
jgi:hypothetical protein